MIVCDETAPSRPHGRAGRDIRGTRRGEPGGRGGVRARRRARHRQDAPGGGGGAARGCSWLRSLLGTLVGGRRGAAVLAVAVSVGVDPPPSSSARGALAPLGLAGGSPRCSPPSRPNPPPALPCR